MVVCAEPVVDELFQLKIRNSLRIKRTVEILELKPVKDRRDRGGGDPCACGDKQDDDRQSTQPSKLTWVKVDSPGHPLLDFTTEV